VLSGFERATQDAWLLPQLRALAVGGVAVTTAPRLARGAPPGLYGEADPARQVRASLVRLQREGWIRYTPRPGKDGYPILVAPADAPWPVTHPQGRQRLERCQRGHSMIDGDPNVYVFERADGRVVRSCKTCRRDSTRRSRRAAS
jgi:hypothetical protein